MSFNIISVRVLESYEVLNLNYFQLIGRRKMCEYANTLEDEVSTLRKSEQEMRSELERVRKIMSSISTPPFLEGVTACQNIPDTSLS